MKLLTLAFVLVSGAAYAQGLAKPPIPQRVWITEFAAARDDRAGSIAQLPALNKHPPLDLADGTAQTTTLNSQTRYIRIVCEVQCAFSTTGEATTNDILLARIVPEYFAVPGGGPISVIAAP